MSPFDAEEILAGLEIPGWVDTVQADMASTNWQQKADAVTAIGQRIEVRCYGARVCVCFTLGLYCAFYDTSPVNPLPLPLSLDLPFTLSYSPPSVPSIIFFPLYFPHSFFLPSPPLYPPSFFLSSTSLNLSLLPPSIAGHGGGRSVLRCPRSVPVL